MQKLAQIDPSQIDRHPPTIAERKQQSKARQQQEKEELYQQLASLCQIGEYATAKQLARRYEQWGYEIVDGEIIEQLESREN